jgi:hemerythrin-like domain-containing protein
MAEVRDGSRRSFLGLAGGTGLLFLDGGLARARGGEGDEAGEEDVSPAEDLMREHGALDRLLLIYDEAIRRLDGKADLDPAILASSAGIVRRFIEGYHEKLEEDHLFPRFEQAKTLVDLVGTLRVQHRAGREVTDRIQTLATPAALKGATERARLTEALREFVRMYRPHAAREDTVLFPALHRLVSRHEYDAMGEQFEDEEHRLFGEDGFEKVVDEVAGLERRMGIADLAQFTPAG